MCVVFHLSSSAPLTNIRAVKHFRLFINFVIKRARARENEDKIVVVLAFEPPKFLEPLKTLERCGSVGIG